MEEELFERIRTLISVGDRYVKKRNFELAYDSYLDALYAIGAVIAYRETGRLMSIKELKPFLQVKYPDLYGVLERYAGILSFDEATVTALKNDLLELIGMMNLPSPEE